MNTTWKLLGRVLFWFAWPALWVYLRIGARTRVCIMADGHILLVQGWLSDGAWMLPGGGLHRGEDKVAGAIREVQEETGITLHPDSLRPLAGEWGSSRGLRSYLHFFVAKLDTTPNLTPQRGEITAVGWFKLSELTHMPLKPEVTRAVELLATAG